MFENLFIRYPFFRYIPGILGMAILFRSSATTGSDISFLVPPMDKILHGLAYLCLGLACSLWAKPILWKTKKIKAFLIAFGIPVIYGALDEFHQSFVPGRDAGIPDFIADSVGALLGFLIYFVLMKYMILPKMQKENS